jgi:potassium efflux system protein
VTIALARNLSGALEIGVLQWFALEPGDRYAITSISRYLIMVIGAFVIFKTLGIGWGQVQWLVAALGFGLGFGLQEIFANFVSGLIILLERPIRVGDTVTVGNYSGTISRIRIRATTMTDWDRKEVLIPNKLFLTDQ